MDKIEFKDLPDTTTPIDADNLNLLQSYIENTITPMQNSLSNLIGNVYDNVNLNDFTTTGVYYMGTNISNLPSEVGGYMYVLVMNAGGVDLVQLGITVAAIPKLYIRARISEQGVTSWKNWVEIGG